MAEALIAAIPPVARRIGRPRSKPDAVLADKGYDSIAFRDYLERRGILAVISQRKRRDIIGLGGLRWVVERTIAPDLTDTPTPPIRRRKEETRP